MLSTTEAAVLGMLTREEEMSGYDLHKHAMHTVAHFWAPAQSGIYALLPRLVEAGYLTRREVAQRGKPDKQLFRITTAGREALRDWLKTAPTREPERSPFLLKLFFGALLEPDEVIEQIERRRQDARDLITQLDRYEAAYRSGTAEFRERDFFPSLTRAWGYAYAEALLAWTDDAEQKIRARLGPRQGDD